MALASALAQRCLLLDFPSTPPHAMPVDHQVSPNSPSCPPISSDLNEGGEGMERIWAIHFGLSWIERHASGWSACAAAVDAKSPTCRWATLC